MSMLMPRVAWQDQYKELIYIDYNSHSQAVRLDHHVNGVQVRIDEVNEALLRAKLPFGAKAANPMDLSTYAFQARAQGLQSLLGHPKGPDSHCWRRSRDWCVTYCA